MKIIGIVMRVEKFDQRYKWFVNETYLNAIENLQVAVFPICSYASLCKAERVCCGLIIPGGYDVHGGYIHEPLSERAQTYERSMDHFDLTCIHHFVKRQKPILGICRGMQMLNVYFKGTLLQHIDESLHAPQQRHTIQTMENSFLRLLYQGSIEVNSYHHQCIATLGEHLKLAALAQDSHIEAIEHEDGKIIGVQWHPEAMEDNQIFPYFLDIVCA